MNKDWVRRLVNDSIEQALKGWHDKYANLDELSSRIYQCPHCGLLTMMNTVHTCRALPGEELPHSKEPSVLTRKEKILEVLYTEPFVPGGLIPDDSLYGIKGLSEKLYKEKPFCDIYKSAQSLTGNLSTALNHLAINGNTVVRVPGFIRIEVKRGRKTTTREQPAWAYYKVVPVGDEVLVGSVPNSCPPLKGRGLLGDLL